MDTTEGGHFLSTRTSNSNLHFRHIIPLIFIAYNIIMYFSSSRRLTYEQKGHFFYLQQIIELEHFYDLWWR